MKVKVLAMGLVWCVLGCGSSPVTLKYGARSYAPGDYEEVYERWTRENEEFEMGQLQYVLAAAATFEAWDFRWAYTVRYAYDYGLTTTEREQMLHTAHQGSLNTHSFLVTLAGSNFRESDLTSKHTAWRAILINDKGQSITPVKIDKIDGVYAPERVYFPTISRHRMAFRISFPGRFPNQEPVLTQHSTYAILRFTGALGTLDLQWKFQSDGS